MPIACPHCHGTGYLPDARPAVSTDRLKAACQQRGLWLSPDDMVREADAATLIGQAPKTLANWRYGEGKLAYTTRRGRPLYALADLADFLART